MEIKQTLKSLISLIILILVCFMLQTSVFNKLKLASVAPNLMLVVTAAIGFMKGSTKGLFTGFFCGLILDCYFGSLLGILALFYMVIGYLNGFFRRLLFSDDYKLPMALIFSSDLVFGLFMYLVEFLFRNKYELGFYFMNIMMPEAVYTTMVGLLVYFCMTKIDNMLNGTDR